MIESIFKGAMITVFLLIAGIIGIPYVIGGEPTVVEVAPDPCNTIVCYSGILDSNIVYVNVTYTNGHGNVYLWVMDELTDRVGPNRKKILFSNRPTPNVWNLAFPLDSLSCIHNMDVYWQLEWVGRHARECGKSVICAQMSEVNRLEI